MNKFSILSRLVLFGFLFLIGSGCKTIYEDSKPIQIDVPIPIPSFPSEDRQPPIITVLDPISWRNNQQEKVIIEVRRNASSNDPKKGVPTSNQSKSLFAKIKVVDQESKVETLVIRRKSSGGNSAMLFTPKNNVRFDEIEVEADFELPIYSGEQTFIVEAIDGKGNKATKEFRAFGEEVKKGRQGKDYAFFIAVANYDNWGTLANPISDARNLQIILKNDYGFISPPVLENPTRDAIIDSLDSYRNRYKFGPDDQVFLYFSGHGFGEENGGDGFLVAKDSEKQGWLTSSFIAHTDFQARATRLFGAKGGHLLMVIDACRSGRFDRDIAQTAGKGASEAHKQKEVAEYWEEIMQPITRKFITSDRGDTDSVDGQPGEGSPLTLALMDILKSKKGTSYIRYEEIITELSKKWENGTPNHERKYPRPHHGAMEGDQNGSTFLFIPKKK